MAPPPPEPAIAQGPRAGLRLVVAFPGLEPFERPLWFGTAPGDEAHYYVVEQVGRIVRFARSAPHAREVVADLSARVSRRGNEEGLLGLAFAPDFATSRELYVYYSASEGGGLVGGRSILARLRAKPSGQVAEGEEVLLALDQPYRNHNGGALAFGPDGYLYLGLGDGGWRGDPEENGQKLSTLLGSILRLDVSGKQGALPYRIPPDNPFVDRQGARAEIYAYGLRNPWRFSFDASTGELWVGDVGQDRFEEVHRVSKGDNCGWRRFEAFSVYDDAVKAPDAVPPLVAYGRGEGISITGGYVYRGEDLPALSGCYLFGDFGTGALWSLRPKPAAPATDSASIVHARDWVVEKLFAQGPPLASFGVDERGELYAVCFDGQLYRLVGPER